MNVWRRIATRVLGGLAVLWGTTTFTFLTLHLTPGDPALTILGGEDALPSRAAVARVRAEYRLDRPLLDQYAFYLNNVAHGNLGQSYWLRIPVTRAIGEQLGPTVDLALSSAIFAVSLAILVATFTAGRPRALRAVVHGAELTLSSVPSFVVGMVLLLVFSFKLYLLPAAGSTGWAALVLPTATLGLPIAAVLSQVLRRELDEILEQPFIMTARARGLSETAVIVVHALRHALLPLVTLSGFVLGGLLGGAVVVESLFARQGLGRLVVEATSNKDVPLVLGITQLAAATYVVANLLVDLLYPVIDPRLRTE